MKCDMAFFEALNFQTRNAPPTFRSTGRGAVPGGAGGSPDARGGDAPDSNFKPR